MLKLFDLFTTSNNIPRVNDPTASTVATESRLLGSPGELRNRIYDSITLDHVTLRREKIVPHALARTCRHLRADFFPIFKDLDTSQVKCVALILRPIKYYASWGVVEEHKLISKSYRHAEMLKTTQEIFEPLNLQLGFLTHICNQIHHQNYWHRL